jgi:electron transfer flavoprotein beta subunit
MKIVVCVKQVPARDSVLRVRPDGRWIEESDLTFEINEPDAYALEEALQVRDAAGGEVVVVCAGAERAISTIREALAKGADRGIHITLPEGAVPDSLATARLLASAIQAESPDLILTGLQSDDLGSGQSGVVLAELLGLPHASIIMQVEVTGGGLKVKRELEDGWFQHVALPLPALLTIQSGIKKLRYATLMGIKKAKGKPVQVIDAAAGGARSGAGGEAVLPIRRMYPPQRAKQIQMLTGAPEQVAAQLVEKLRFEARVL